jgi:hypothetical protein
VSIGRRVLQFEKRHVPVGRNPIDARYQQVDRTGKIVRSVLLRTPARVQELGKAFRVDHQKRYSPSKLLEQPQSDLFRCLNRPQAPQIHLRVTQSIPQRRELPRERLDSLPQWEIGSPRGGLPPRSSDFFGRPTRSFPTEHPLPSRSNRTLVSGLPSRFAISGRPAPPTMRSRMYSMSLHST